MIVAIEGTDAAGKCTQSTLLAKKLNATRFAFPAYDTPSGELIRRHLHREWDVRHVYEGMRLDKAPSEMEEDVRRTDAMVFQALQTVNRFELLPQIRKALDKGPVVFDRYTASGLVYGGLDGLDPKWIEQINESLPQPDVYIYLDIPIEESFKRRPDRRDRYEQNREYLEKVRTAYLNMFGWADTRSQPVERRVVVDHVRRANLFSRWYVVDGMGTIEEVQERIWSVSGPLQSAANDSKFAW